MQLCCDPSARPKEYWATRVGRLAWGLWGFLVLSLAFLALWHLQMDALLDVEMQHIRDRPTFYALRRVYLWTCTVQWMAGVILLFLQVQAWQREPLPVINTEPSTPSSTVREDFSH